LLLSFVVFCFFTHKEEKKWIFNGCWRLINTDDCHVKCWWIPS
jgi:hypothetical protein